MKVSWVIAAFLISLIIATVGDLMKEELRSRLDRMPHTMLRLAIRRLPLEVRQSIGDEWQAELHFILHRAEGLPITRLVAGVRYALGLLRTARRIGRKLRIARNGCAPASGRSAGSSLSSFQQLALAGGMAASITTASVAATVLIVGGGGVIAGGGAIIKENGAGQNGEATTSGVFVEAGVGNPKPTFQDPLTFRGRGPSVQPGQQVEVICRLHDPNAPPSVQPGWWYRLASAPWNGQYYTVANSYLNGDPLEGPHLNDVDAGVPVC